MKVMFVCTGNTCRSVMLQYMFANYLKNRGETGIDVTSAGLMVSGEMMSKECADVLDLHNVAHDNHISTQCCPHTLDDVDVVFCMSSSQREALAKMRADIKVYDLSTLAKCEIFDPYGQSIDAYKQIYNIFDNLLESILNIVKLTYQAVV